MYMTVTLKGVVKRIIMLYYCNCFNILINKNVKVLILSETIKAL